MNAAARSAPELWCVRKAAGASIGPVVDLNFDRLPERLDHHRVWSSFLRHGPGLGDVPAELLQRARAEVTRQISWELRSEADTRLLASTMTRAGVRWAVVKGPVLGAIHKRAGSSRVSHDLDVLVSPKQFANALHALLDDGFHLINRNLDLLRRELPAEIVVRAPLGTVVDLHWNLVHHRDKRARTPIPTADLLEQTRFDGVAGCPALHPADALTHVCLHAAASGGNRLAWMLDIALSVRDEPLDWDRVMRRAASWHVSSAVGLVLHRSRSLLEAPVPDHVVRAMAPASWRLVISQLGRVHHANSDLGRWASALLRAASEDRSLPAALGRAASRNLRGQVKAQQPFRQTSKHPGSALFPSGDARDLAAYLDSVGRQA